MPTASRVPSYRLHKATGQAIVTFNRRDVYLGKFGTPESRAEYDRVVAEWLSNRAAASLVAPGAKVPTDLTIAELLDGYFRHAAMYYVKNGRPTSEIRCLEDAAKPLFELYGTTTAGSFGPRNLVAVRQRMIDRDLCRRLINFRVNRIRRIFKWGVENELVAPAVLEGLRAVAPLKQGRCGVREAPRVLPAPRDHVEAVLAIAPAELAAMIRLQLYTGMRPNEVVQMRLRDVDTSGKVWHYTPQEHKTEHHGRRRVIYLGPRAQEVLQPFLGLELEAFLFSPQAVMAERSRRRRVARKTPLTPSQRARRPRDDGLRRPGERYTTQSYGRAIAELCDRAMPWPGLAGRSRRRLSPAEREQRKVWRREHRWSPNRLRHSAATELRKEFGIETARVVLGHSSAGVTEIYAEQDLEKAAKAMERVG